MQITKRFPLYICLVLLAYMPFHIFLSQSLSLITGGLDTWKIAKDILLAVATMFVICTVWARGKGDKTFWIISGFTALYGLLHLVLWAVTPDVYRQSAILGTTYNVRLFCFLILGYGAVRLLSGSFKWRPVIHVVIGAATVVALLGIVQYFLPKDTLTHVGYGLDRGVRANFLIDGADGFPRIMSTLRDPNSLGAYLVVPMTWLAVMVLRPGERRRRMCYAVALIVMGIAVLLTFSRSAWMAVALSLGLVALWQYRQRATLFVKRFGLAGLAFLLIISAVAYSQRHGSFVTSYITHSSQGSTDVDSNELHWQLVKQGLEGIADKPLGHGPGSAGLASIQNPHGGVLTENYYVQIGYEVGIIGLALFVGMQIWLYARLWRLRQSSIAVVLLASFWGYVVMNMLLHTWSNEAVACQWWLLTGLALAAISGSEAKRSSER